MEDSTMNFGLMYEIQVPEPHYDGIEQERYKQVMAQVELADEVGFAYFWTVEHHFLREFSHCSAPEVLYGAISQRTKRIRIGHAVALLPGQYNHPVRVAERAAVLDIVSDGRMDLGTGRSTTLIEMDGFQVDPEETKAQWEEAISMIPQMWMQDPFSHEGRFYQIPPRSVIPKPVQKPHPPLWVACSQPDSFRAAGEMGLGALCFNLGGYAQMAERVGVYREGIKHAKPVGSFVNNQIAALCVTHCAETDEEAHEFAGPEGVWFVNMAEKLYAPWQGRKVPDSYTFAVSAVQRERAGKTFQDHMQSGAFAMGNPDTVIKVLKKYQEAGIDQILCFMQMGNLAHARIMDSIKLFGRYVIPYFT
jgi:alkanesulfonate monooxygenase SsuD/methylene tetrahydromethanopterin reductase-like flavin-dependent oxidoreductase (luciferase family)